MLIKLPSLIGVCLLVMVWLVAVPAAGQVVREEGVSAIAGVVGEVGDAFDDYTFTSSGGEILFASVDAQIYMGRTHEDEHGESDPAEGHEPGGSGGCGGEEGGPGGLCLQVLDQSGQVVAWAKRPPLPGWQRDPRLVCIIPVKDGKPATYTIRVLVADETCGDTTYATPDGTLIVPYVLNLSLRRIADEGGVSPAIAASRNRF